MNKTQWKIVAIEETHYWCEDIVARAGRLFGIYMFDANRYVYCCEITPSYEMYFIETVHEKCHGEGGVHEEVLENDFVDRPTADYFHCNNVNAMDPKWIVEFPKHDVEYETDEAWEEERESMLEFLRGNQYVPAGVPFVADEEQA